MTGENHCYDNELAERVNGTLKHEYNLKDNFPSKRIAKAAIQEAIELYCTDRPHLALGMKTPQEVYFGK